MVKKILLYSFLVILIVAAVAAWKLLGPGTSFEGNRYFLYIKTGSNFSDVMQDIRKDKVLISPWLFEKLSERADLPEKLKAGKYEITRGMNLINVVRMLRNGRQSPVNLIITKLRTKEEFAKFAGHQLECDSAAIISLMENPDSTKKFGVDSNTVMTLIIPNTYTMYWNTTPSKLIRRLYSESEKFWNEERKDKARKLGLTTGQVYTLASIVEEETNKHDEMPLISSVYLNRVNKGMRLGADPTIKFAARDFAARRVTLKMISETSESPYNTYRNAGLPPGPICTPSIKTIDAILSTEPTNYLYFCAKPDFSGYHAFAETDAEHLKNARAYQKALDSLQIR
ncbi:MAG: endolytic transglycosylase MltG [Bacteroidetes bacterium]|nr:MAG: endolytic transglycosylase MltG [Bacteroidota bacterium]